MESQGFQTTEQKDIRLQVDEQREIDFTLNPASVSSDGRSQRHRSRGRNHEPTLGQVITAGRGCRPSVERTQLRPTRDADARNHASTNPNSFFNGAASSEAATRGSFSLSVGGSREQSTDWLLDGNDNNQLDEGGIAILLVHR